jgi:hypothetical protein
MTPQLGMDQRDASRPSHRRALVALLLAAFLAPLLAWGPGGATTALGAEGGAKVAIIVGPVGPEITPRYRAIAEEAAAIARKYTANVVRVYSPNATWPAVQEAVRGASIVIYLGHGNGWPSRYRDSLYPPSQNGFGLNPVAGNGDDAHQYFGEKFVEGLRIAKGAVILLHHLCYASGNSEPGLPEGTRSDAIQRVDNFAAGFLRAGASAVIAEAHRNPAWYLDRLLGRGRALDDLWHAAPWHHGNAFSERSTRTKGATLWLDPDRADGGYHRSLVTTKTRPVAPAAQASGAPDEPPEPPPIPSLAGLGLSFGIPSLDGRPAANEQLRLMLPLSPEQQALLPATPLVGMQWTPIDEPLPGSEPGEEAGEVAAEDVGSEVAAEVDATQIDAAATEPGDAEAEGSPAPEPAAAPEAPVDPDVEAPDDAALPEGTPVILEGPELVVPERASSIVTTVAAALDTEGLTVTASLPERPGRYRLVITLHEPDGVAYDAATQDLVVPLLVTVPHPIAAYVQAPARLTARAGSFIQVPLTVANTGTVGWAQDLLGLGALATDAGWLTQPGVRPATIAATWASPTGGPVPRASATIVPRAASRPGGAARFTLESAVPDEPGRYLLILEIVSPMRGSLATAGVAPAVVVVEVQ